MIDSYTLMLPDYLKTTTVGLLLLAGNAFSQNWTGAAGTDWNNPANWTAWPLNGSDVLVDPSLYTVPGNHPEITANSVFTPANITVQNGASIVIAANLVTQENFEILGNTTNVTMTSGNLSVGPGNEGRLVCDLGGSMVINGGSVVADERIISGEDALITVNNGTVSTGERLLLDLGGHIIQNGGVITVAETFALADGNLNGSCYFEKHGGTLLVNGEMALENETGNFEPTFFMDGGTFTVNGTITWFGEAPGTGRPRFIAEGGQVTINGNIENAPLSTVNMHMELSNNCNFTMTSGTLTLLYAADSVKQTNHTAAVLQDAAVINAGVVFSENSQLEINGSTTVSGNGTTVLNSLQINPGSMLTNAGNNGIILTGDLVNNGQMNNTTRPVFIAGGMMQMFSGSSDIVFYDLVMEQPVPAGATSTVDIEIQNQLQLNAGIIEMNGSTLRLLNDAVSGPGNPGSFVSGPVRKTGDDAFVFPVGKNGKWMRFSMSAPAVVNADVTVEFFDDGFPGSAAVNPPLEAVNPGLYWNVETTVDPGPVTVQLFWEDALEAGITSCTDLTLAEWNGTAWDHVPSTVSGICAGMGSGTVAANSALPPGEYYTFGYFGNVTSIESQICAGDSVLIGGNYYTTDGMIVVVLPDTDGGDSTVIADIGVVEPVMLSQTVVLCPGQVFGVGSSVYSIPGTYIDTLAAFSSCDSIVTTELLPAPAIDLNISVTGTTAQVNPSYPEYGWLDCVNGMMLIPGETSSEFTPTADGSFAAIIGDGQCFDTTACVAISGVGIQDYPAAGGYFFPNPTTGEIHFRLPGDESLSLIIHTLSGEMVFHELITPAAKVSLENTLVPGSYLLTITDAEGLVRMRELLIYKK